MRLLIITQVIDTQDPVLGFFHEWIARLATTVESVEAICLREGEHSLPLNVRVHSLGKERGVGRVSYIIFFYRYIWKLRHEYNAVFVHMNQEYILLGGPLWLLLRKKIFLWRNHYQGSLLTDVAASFCTEVFCTSKHSYTARYKRTVLMPVGVNVELFSNEQTLQRNPRSVLFLGRLAPSKRPEMLIDGLGNVLAQGISFTATIVGSPEQGDEPYARSLAARAESLGLHDRIRFEPSVPNSKTPDLYAAHDIFVNCSRSGMFDKTLFEAAASGCRVIAASDDFHSMADDEVYAPDVDSLTEKLILALNAGEDAVIRRRIFMKTLARQESLGTLIDLLSQELKSHVH